MSGGSNARSSQGRIAEHLRFLAQHQQGDFSLDALSSIPFYNLCRSLFLPMSGVRDFDSIRLFGTRTPRLSMQQSESHLIDFMQRDIGLSDVEKIACLTGDPFLGRPSTFRQDSLLRLLRSVWFIGPKMLLSRLAEVGDVGLLFAESRPNLKSDQPLSSAELLRTLALLAGKGMILKQRVLGALLQRCGRLEAYCLARLLLSRTGFGRELNRPLVVRVLASHYRQEATAIERGLKLTDVFQLTSLLSREGGDGLRRLRLRPLSPVRPALASGPTTRVDTYPVWVERKYDGVRMLLHRSVVDGRLQAAAFTRNGNDWLEQFPGLRSLIRSLPVSDAIVDGELYGVMRGSNRVVPATVQEVMAAYHGELLPMQLHYAAFDVLYFNGQDVTLLPFTRRRQLLSSMILPLTGRKLPIPVSLAVGQMANTEADVNRLYHHFRAQGHEGVITKDPASPYLIDTRDPRWLKRKPILTLDLVLIGATYSVTTQNEGMFGSWVVGALNGTTIEDVGDVDGVDRVRDAEICDEIIRRALLTGRTITRTLSMGKRIGVELFPQLVVTVICQGVARDQNGAWSLRHPRIAVLRADKRPEEADSVEQIRSLQREPSDSLHVQR
ncbi:MAG: hypothetical protein O3A00_26375 [Planctomycetota bacterium]|nr:hypothetical protein [Planctomycetota bacterium]